MRPYGRAESRTYQKGEEQSSCGEEVPDIVVIEEAQQDARPVLLPGLCWSLLGERAGPCQTHSALRRAPCSTPP